MIECYHCGAEVEKSKATKVQHTERNQTERICPTCVFKQTPADGISRDL